MATKKTNLELVLNGILDENPIFRLALSMCPAVAITTNIMNGIMMGVAVLFVQVASSCTISLVQHLIHPRIRIPTYTLVIATWVTVIDLLLGAYFPAAYSQVGIFVKLIVAFAIITMRLEMFASKNTLQPSFWDGFGMGMGFLIGMILIGAIRELLGLGTLLGYDILGTQPLLFFVLPCAGFFVVGLLMGFFNYIEVAIKQQRLKVIFNASQKNNMPGRGDCGCGAVDNPLGN